MSSVAFFYCELCEAGDVQRMEALSCPEKECPVRQLVGHEDRIAELVSTIATIRKKAESAASALQEDKLLDAKLAIESVISLTDADGGQ